MGLAQAVPWAHLPFVKAELKVYPRRNDSVSLDGRGRTGQSRGRKAPGDAVLSGRGSHRGCVGRLGVSTTILKGFPCGWVRVATTLYSEFESQSRGSHGTALKTSNKIRLVQPPPLSVSCASHVSSVATGQAGLQG